MKKIDVQFLRERNSLEGLDLQFHDFSNADVSLISFDEAILSNCNFSNANLEGSIFSDSILDGANLIGADLYMCFMYRASLKNVDLTGASMLGVNLREANLQDANLSVADLGVSNIGTRTRLQGANLRETVIFKTNFKSAEYDVHTRFPEGFDPVANGMILTNDDV